MKTVITVLMLWGAKILLVASNAAGPVGPIKLYEFGPCSEDVNNIDLTMQLNTEADKSNSVTFSFNMPHDFGDELMLSLVAEKWENNAWKEDAFTESDRNFMEFANEHLEVVWENFRQALEPQIEDSNLFPAGEYSIKGHKESYKNIGLPQILYGRFRAEISIYTEEEDLVCLKVEAETYPP
ncbi:hypothetical protein MTP99_017969 [Tenebrio molitor]|uniref:Uncharacterized protein n=1 Tax=Tenebrio molitor TaxID=7067 RepID=A0A8J6LDZ1_TENMO|nr:hypothetical protein GEV33_003797 [Tenebrio molitor]KAJ3624333.1 hypothetical protein MTP99_017969 [Tenebrio molitor]